MIYLSKFNLSAQYLVQLKEIMQKEPVIIFWSGGKDCYLALEKIKMSETHYPFCLFSVIDKKSNQIKFHGVKESLLVKQAELLKLPLQRVYLEENSSNEVYLNTVQKFLDLYLKKGIKTLVFGDIHLKDVKEFREKSFKELGFETLYPLWGMSGREAASEFIKSGAKAVVTSVMTEKLDNSFLAKEFDEDYIKRLPENIDPSGENGEFHTFVYYGKEFKIRVPFSKSIGLKDGPYTVSHLKDA